MIIFSSNGIPGKGEGSLPVAMRIFLAWIVSVLLSLVLTSLHYQKSLHAILTSDAAHTLDIVCLVLFEEELDAACETAYNFILLLLGGLPVHGKSTNFNSKPFEMLVGILVLVGDVEQSLRGNTPNVEAGTTKSTSLFDTDSFQT